VTGHVDFLCSGRTGWLWHIVTDGQPGERDEDGSRAGGSADGYSAAVNRHESPGTAGLSSVRRRPGTNNEAGNPGEGPILAEILQ